MAENIQELIEKIQNEGVLAAEARAAEIQAQANQRKEEIISQASKQADHLIAEARERIAKMQQASDLALQQSGRDLLLVLRKEIASILEKVMVLEIRNALTPEELAGILKSIIQAQSAKNSGEIVIHLNKDDLKKLEHTFLKGLKEDVLKGIKLKSQDDIAAGFIISYDAGRSHFDFTDKALAETLGAYLKPGLAEILKSAAI